MEVKREDFDIVQTRESQTIDGRTILVHKKTGITSVPYKRPEDAEVVLNNVLAGMDKTFLQAIEDHSNS